MFGNGDDGSLHTSTSDEAIETLIKLLVPPGWIPEADGTTSVIGALLMTWGEGGMEVPPGGANQKRVRGSVLRLICWLFGAYPLQTLAAILHVSVHTKMFRYVA
jgi:hypothetical protein